MIRRRDNVAAASFLHFFSVATKVGMALGGINAIQQGNSYKCAVGRGWSKRLTTASLISPRCACPASRMTSRVSRSRCSGTPRSTRASSRTTLGRRSAAPHRTAPRLSRLSARYSLAVCHRRRSGSAAGPVPGRHPARRLSAASVDHRLFRLCYFFDQFGAFFRPGGHSPFENTAQQRGTLRAVDH